MMEEDRSLVRLMMMGNSYLNNMSPPLIPTDNTARPTIGSAYSQSITTTSATLNGIVTANGLLSHASFEYGTSSNYGTEINSRQGQLNGYSPTNISCTIENLIQNTTYYYRVKAINSKGITYGFMNSFTTSQVNPTQGYQLSDFGENAINNHASGDGWHSEKNQVIFNYVTRDFRNRCTSFQTYNNTWFNYGMITPLSLLPKAAATDCDIIYTPYVDAAHWMNGSYSNFVLPVGSHYSNPGSDGIEENDNRHDLTVNKDTFLANSIAVSARRDTADGIFVQSSYGFGMEFFEDVSKEGLDIDYPDKDIAVVIAEVRTSADGYIVYGNRTMDMVYNPNLHINIGDSIRLINGELTEDRIISEIIGNGSYRVTQPFTPYVVNGHIILEKIIDGVATKIGEVGTENNGGSLRAYNIVSTDFTGMLPNTQLKLTYPDNHVEYTTIENVDRYDLINITTNVTVYNIPGIYMWSFGTLADYCDGQAQSWAVPIVAGKLKVIKMSTGADWPTVRSAARATAKRNHLGIPELDNDNWDIYRGFGQIQVQAAIDYINSL